MFVQSIRIIIAINKCCICVIFILLNIIENIASAISYTNDSDCHTF